MRVFRRSRVARRRRPLRVWRSRLRTPRGPAPAREPVRRSRDRAHPLAGHVRRAGDRVRLFPGQVRRARDRVRLFWERLEPSPPLVLLLACLPGLAAVLALVMSAVGSDGTGHHSTRPEAARSAQPHRAPRPPIMPRARWLDEDARSQPPARYDKEVAAVFIHHTDSPNGYDCADAPRIIRHLYAGQTGARHWDDIGYNFLVDRCGTIYEGRAGGVDRPVTGAHTQGFNHRTAGIAALGTFTGGVAVPQAMTDAIAALAAWKLGLSDIDPRGSARLTSSNSLSRYSAGTTVLLPALTGHSDGYQTSCPGAALAERLPAMRELAARLQGRR